MTTRIYNERKNCKVIYAINCLWRLFL